MKVTGGKSYFSQDPWQFLWESGYKNRGPRITHSAPMASSCTGSTTATHTTETITLFGHSIFKVMG